MASSSQQHAVNIEKLSAFTEEKLQMLPPLSSKPCIYKVPDRMRVSNKQLFSPRVVSIGPIHYKNKKLRANEHLKERYLAEFIQLSGVSVKEYFQHISNNEKILRNCYAHIIELNSENFMKMVLMDAAFLVMMLLYNSGQILTSSTDQLFGKPRMMNCISDDLVLLENQLPFFILENLYKLSKLHDTLHVSKFDPDVNEETAMTVLAYKYLRKWVLQSEVPEQQPPSKAEHILDLFRSCLIPTDSDWKPERTDTKIINMPSVKELYQSGVKIRVGSKENKFAIRFQLRDGILKIPPISIYDDTELMFRNHLAFEQCHCLESTFSDYVVMMRLLILSSEDAELLIQKGVIINGLPNARRVSTLFQNIDTGNVVNMSRFLYSDVIKNLNQYYKSCWHRWKATLKQKYFKAPWAICSVSLAVCLLVLTIVQAVFTILQVVLPDHK